MAQETVQKSHYNEWCIGIRGLKWRMTDSGSEGFHPWMMSSCWLLSVPCAYHTVYRSTLFKTPLTHPSGVTVTLFYGRDDGFTCICVVLLYIGEAVLNAVDFLHYPFGRSQQTLRSSRDINENKSANRSLRRKVMETMSRSKRRKVL